MQLPTDGRATCRIGISNSRASNGGRYLCVQISRERSHPLPIYWYHLKGNWLRYNFTADSFCIMKLMQQTSRPLLSKLSERLKIYVFDPHFEEVRGGVEPWLMAHWKARVDFLLRVSELLFLSLTVEALQGKTCQTSLLSGGWVTLSQDFRGKGSSLGNICWFLQN